MLIFERQSRLMDLLRQRKSAQLDDMAVELGVSTSTVRRDLEQLAQRGLVERTHGGAVFKSDVIGGMMRNGVDALMARMNDNVAAKTAIARAAAALVRPHNTVLLDGGSTIIFTAHQIAARPIQVVTNSLAIAAHFADDDQVELMVIGGSHYPRTGVLLGPVATGCLADLHADLCFFSVAGIWGEETFNLNLAMAEVEQVMMRQAARKILLTDSSKFGRKSLVRVCALADFDNIITDSGVESPWREQIGHRLIIADI